MNKSQLLQMWDLMRQRHGIGLRCIEALPADKLDSHAIPNMRTPKELVVHMYDLVIRAMAEGVLRGKITADESAEKRIAAKIKNRDELLKFARDCWDAADTAVSQITDHQLAGAVGTPWNFNAPGAFMFGITLDEYLHHRGQLYAYLRALGVEPPMMWDFEHNAPEYQPKAHAHA